MITSCAPIPFMRSNIPSPSRSSVPSTCSAGNLLGTTRRSHPGAFAPLPFCRYDSTSGGVIDSRPGQNGQCSRPSEAARSRRKSLGRFCRSVEIITHRPVIGSLRNSGIECVLENLDLRSTRVEMNRDDVEPAGAAGQMMSRHVIHRQLRDPVLLEPCDRLGCLAKGAAITRLDLDEDQRRAVARDDIQFTTAAAIAPGKDCVPAALQLPAREIFAGFAEDLPGA